MRLLPRKRQCELLGVPRSSSYYKPRKPSAEQVRQEASQDEALHKDSTARTRRWGVAGCRSPAASTTAAGVPPPAQFLSALFAFLHFF